MTRWLVYALAALFLALIISVAWWTLSVTEGAEATMYTVQAADTAHSIADDFGVDAGTLAVANDSTIAGFEPKEGEVIAIPPVSQEQPSVWVVHSIGLTAEVVGVLMSFWLALVAGLLPADLRGQILGIGLVLGLASYAAAQGVAPGDPQLTPQFVFGAVKDGFAWSAAFPLFATAFGLVRSLGRRLDSSTQSQE